MPPNKSRQRKETQRGLLEVSWPWIIRFAGLGIALYETLATNIDRPSLLVLAAAMIGLPEFINIGRKDSHR